MTDALGARRGQGRQEMGGSRLRRIARPAVMAAVALTLSLGLTACLPGLKGPTPPTVLPPTDPPPFWNNTTLGFNHQPLPGFGTTTGWMTTVTITASVSNGSLFNAGGGAWIWTRAVTGSPAQRVTGTFTANCHDSSNQFAHPTLAATVT